MRDLLAFELDELEEKVLAWGQPRYRARQLFLWLHGKGVSRIEEMPNTGVPIGIVGDTAYAQAGPVTIEAGDVVAIGTDGIWESRGPDGDLFGKDRLRDILKAHADASARDVFDAVIAAVSAFRGSEPQEDDVTLVVIKRLE